MNRDDITHVDSEMLHERPLPRYPLGRAIAIVASFTAIASVIAWLSVYLDSSILQTVLFLPVIVVGYFYYYRRRCPECGSHLAIRQEYIHGTKRFRLLFDCPRCQIAWDTGQLGDEHSID